MNFKIVSDSSSNVLSLQEIAYETVPLKIITNEREYVDQRGLDVSRMVAELKLVKGQTRTSCPNVCEWSEAMEGADGVFAIAITSGLSGSYSTAVQAKSDLQEKHPDMKIAVIDSKSTGPEMQLLIERIKEGILEGKSFEEIEEDVCAYQKKTHLIFSLASMTNLARNGRVSPIVAKLAGVLGIRVVGVASEQGTLEPLYKPRGKEKTLSVIYAEMKKRGYCGGRVRIAHCFNQSDAGALIQMIRAEYPSANIVTGLTTGLCSYYAEDGGLLVGFEG